MTRGVWIDVTYRPARASATDASETFSIHQRLLLDGGAAAHSARGSAEPTTISWAEDDNTWLVVGGVLPPETLQRIATSLERVAAGEWASYEATAADR